MEGREGRKIKTKTLNTTQVKMEPVPLLPKPKFLPNSDATTLLRELFQDEFQAAVPSKKITENIVRGLHCEEENEYEDGLGSIECLDCLANSKDNVIEFTGKVLKAYITHEKNLKDIREAEKNIFETHADFLNREITALERNETARDFQTLKRQPLFKALDPKYVKKYKLLQGEAGLPLKHELNSDFRVQNFKKWRKELENMSQESLITKCLRRTTGGRKSSRNQSEYKKMGYLLQEFKKGKKPSSKNKKERKKQKGKLKAEPKILFFTDYKIGDVYAAQINLSTTYSKAVKFQLKPLPLEGPFRVMFNKTCKRVLTPGLSLQLTVEFTPRSLDCIVEDIIIVTEDGNRLLIPLIAYLEPPVLKTHKGIDELTNITSELIGSSNIECGACFTGDTKVIKLKFRCYQGSGEFFIMSSENWTRNYVDTVTSDNLLEIPPFRVYPVFFKIKKDEVIDLFVEFAPKSSGTQVENIVIACDNGQVRSLDLLGDAVGWHGYYFTFQDSLLKELPVEKDDDLKVKYYIDFDHTTPNGKLEKVFCVSNNSEMAFEFQWKIREANIVSTVEKYSKLCKYEVKIDPESGTFEPNSVWEFLVTIQFNNAEISKYRMVLSLYVLNLPYQCIEEDNTIIQPTGLVRNLYSQSLYGEEEGSLVSPELASLQGTYESLQESIKSYAEYQHKALAAPKSDFCRTVCIPNPGLCAKPLKKSKTFFNIGDGENVGCACRMKPVAPESISESCVSNTRDDKTEMSPQRNDVIWDFVDILVDEVELWVEVVSTKVTLEPSIIDLSVPLNVNDSPIFKKVTVVNHNQCSVTCTWTTQPETKNNFFTDSNKSNSNSFFLLFEKKSENKNQNLGNQQQFDEELKIKDVEVHKSDSNFQKQGKIIIKPSNSFTVSGLSEFTCEIGISAGQAGRIKEILCLNVNNGDLKLELLIVGTAVANTFEASPDILDFGVLRQGTRYTKEFEILNKNPNILFWKINQYMFDFEEEQFLSNSDAKIGGYIKKTKGVTKKSSAVEPYSLDARVPGIKFSLLEVEENNPESFTSKRQSILILGDVKMPNLALSSPRFANAILAPPGAMFVGQKISKQVTLTNKGKVETFINWGHAFGCHCRKIKLDITPKCCRIEKLQKLTFDIDITALDQGIISHCYVPCFFCRSAVPLILSVVAIVESLNVTFEVVDYPMQSHADARNFLKSPFHHTILRVPWPNKTYDPTLSLKYLNEKDILNMKCQCFEVEEEAARSFGFPKRDSMPEVGDSGNSVRSLKSMELGGETCSQKLTMSPTKSGKTVVEEDKLSNSNLSGSLSLESKKSNESSIIVYSSFDSSRDSSKLKKPHLEFLCVPYQTPVLRQFVIRNETPIETSFQINVSNYGISKNLPDRRLESIKNRVFGSSNDDFQNKLMKNQPLVIVVEPAKGELKPHDAVCINVQCYGNTWGEYRDHLICQVKGIEPFHLKMFIQIIGHPIHFPIFNTQNSLKPVLRFQPTTLIEPPETKQIKVVNRSCIPLTIVWIVFLLKPLPKEEEREDGFNLCSDSNLNIDSHHSEEESAQSSKNYIAKNATGSSPCLSNVPESKDFSEHYETSKSFIRTEPSSLTSPTKRESTDEKFIFPVISRDETKSDMQQILFPGRFDTRAFQVNPKEMFFDPFEEKKISITFDPQSHKPEKFPQEFIGVLAGCVKLKPEDEMSPDLFYRPCGLRFTSEIMDFNAVVEIPTVSFEILKGDLKFIVDSNAVLKSKSNLIVKKFLIKNKNQKSVTVKIEIFPGLVFKVNKVNTIDKCYLNYNPELHLLKIEPGHLIEMELQCLVTNKDIMYAYERFIIKRKKEKCPPQPLGISSKKEKEDDDDNGSSSKSDQSICSYDFDYRNIYAEAEGESFMVPEVEEEIPCVPKPPSHVTVVEEKISFVQCGLVAQSLTAELHISFPAIRVSPNCLDFGNVYLGENAVRYCTFINLTGFSTDFKIVPECNSNVFVATPLTGSLPPTDYKSDIGRTITINFKPSKPGYYKTNFYIYCNLDMVFDCFELFASGFGTWNEKYKSIKFETCNKLDGVYHNLST